MNIRFCVTGSCSERVWCLRGENKMVLLQDLSVCWGLPLHTQTQLLSVYNVNRATTWVLGAETVQLFWFFTKNFGTVRVPAFLFMFSCLLHRHKRKEKHSELIPDENPSCQSSLSTFQTLTQSTVESKKPPKKIPSEKHQGLVALSPSLALNKQ